MRREDREDPLFYPEQNPRQHPDDLVLSRRSMSTINQQREQEFVSLVSGVADMGKFTGLTKNGIDNHVAIVSYIDNATISCPNAEQQLRTIQQLHFRGVCKKILKWGDD